MDTQGAFHGLGQDLASGLGLPGGIGMLISASIGIAAVMGAVTVLAMYLIWQERKVAAHIQVRLGPMRVGGWHGWAQSIADGIKLLMKEDLRPGGAPKVLFYMAPALVLGAALATFVALPLSTNIFIADVNLGVFYIFGIGALSVIGVIMAGWASNNKWSVLGAIREAAQVVSYEIPMGLSLLVPVLMHGTLSLRSAADAQAGWAGMQWAIFTNPFAAIALVLFFVAALANAGRAPFDLPESESELVAGFHTEFSGIRFSFFFLAEYAHMFVVSAVGVALFLGGWHLPGLSLLDGTAHDVASAVIFIAKSWIVVTLMMVIRWTLPRVRIDQVMSMGYRYLTPIGLFCVLGAAWWELYL